MKILLFWIRIPHMIYTPFHRIHINIVISDHNIFWSSHRSDYVVWKPLSSSEQHTSSIFSGEDGKQETSRQQLASKASSASCLNLSSTLKMETMFLQYIGLSMNYTVLEPLLVINNIITLSCSKGCCLIWNSHKLL